MKDENKEQPLQDNFKAMTPVPEKSIIVKNIIFGIFIVLSIIFCFQKYYEKAQMAEFDEGMKLFNAAVETLNDDARKEQALLEFDRAETFFEDILDNNKNEELVVKATEMMAQCYAMMATCPNVLADKTEEYYQKALAADFNCPLVNDAIRLKYAPPEMREVVIQHMQDAANAFSSAAAAAEEADLTQMPELQTLPENSVPADTTPEAENK